ncbi:MAG: hypothetical protein QOF62_71 [Pyrinomonadaceae bacterium]|jgi:hypothetical protein|nr:hypothetical protein [Pyrinomonadaceae bacterium]
MLQRPSLSQDVIRVSRFVPKLQLKSRLDRVPIRRNIWRPKLPVQHDTTDAGALASLSPAPAESKGKSRHFGVYLMCGLFDTLENRVVTSGLTLASNSEAFWYPTKYEGAP